MDTLLSTLDDQSILITANSRLAAHLLNRYGRMRSAGGTAVWRTPDILPLETWLRRSWATLRVRGWLPAERMLLGGTQEELIWRDIVYRDLSRQSVVDPGGAVLLARRAWQLMCDWQLSAARVAARVGSDENRRFVHWLGAYQRRLETAGWQDSASLTAVLSENPGLGDLVGSRSVYFAGFDDYSPAQQRLIARMEERGAQVRLHEQDGAPGRIVSQSFRTRRDEEFAAAAWARNLLEAHPDWQIGVLAVDLSGRRQSVQRAFQQQFSPMAYARVDKGYSAVAISLGDSLSSYPMIADALAILRLADQPVSRGQFSRVLLSPYLGAGAGSLQRRAALELRLRRYGRPQADIRHFLSVLAREDPEDGFVTLVREASGLSLPDRADADRWRDNFDTLLRGFGWPGNDLDSVEYQLLSAWQQLLGEFSQAALVQPRMSQSLAWRTLHDLAVSRIFQPQGDETVPVQISGVLEATGRRFDALWVMGMQEDTWPPPPRPSPFLPLALQKEQDMPHSSIEREVDYARGVTERLRRSADRVVFSWAENDAELALRPSVLVESVATSEEPIAVPRGFDETLCLAGTRDAIEDELGLPLPLTGPVAGGVGLFASQAACPFQGYAGYRLGAGEIEEREPGVGSAERGTLVHRVLEKIWRELGDSASLRRMSPTQLDALIARRLAECASPSAEEIFLPLEERRTFHLIRRWLDRERDRPPFSVIALEEAVTIRVGELDLRCRMDRIDRTESGQTILIDYKTGKTNYRELFDDRLTQPQLPLYAVDRPEIDTVAFVSLMADQVGFDGVGEANDLPGIKPLPIQGAGVEAQTWEELRQFWKRGLTMLAGEIRAGVARVEPRNPPDTCRYCQFSPLCRIDEKHPVLDEGEAGDP